MVTKAGRVVTTETRIMWKNREEKSTGKNFSDANLRRLPDILPVPSTSGSPESRLVWMRILPMRTSLQTALRAGSMVSPARSTETPVIYGDKGVKQR